MFANGQLFLGDAFVGAKQKYQNNYQLCFRTISIYPPFYFHLSTDPTTTELEGILLTIKQGNQWHIRVDIIIDLAPDVAELGIRSAQMAARHWRPAKDKIHTIIQSNFHRHNPGLIYAEQDR